MATMLAMLAPAVAQADAVFILTLQQVGPQAPPDLSARLFATDLGALPSNGEFTQFRVTGATGQLDGVAITGVGGNQLDDLLTVDRSFPAFVQLAFGDGLALSLADGHIITLITGHAATEIFSSPQDLSFSYGLPVQPVIVPEAATTPEPGTMTLVATGVLGTLATLRRRLQG